MRPTDARVAVAVHRYQTEGLSLARAADLAGVSWAQMREILLEKGDQLRENWNSVISWLREVLVWSQPAGTESPQRP